MHKFAYVAAWLLTLAGGLLVAATATYAVWLFWTDPSWAYAKFLALVFVGGPVIAVIANALFNYAARADGPAL